MKKKHQSRHRLCVRASLTYGKFSFRINIELLGRLVLLGLLHWLLTS